MVETNGQGDEGARKPLQPEPAEGRINPACQHKWEYIGERIECRRCRIGNRVLKWEDLMWVDVDEKA